MSTPDTSPKKSSSNALSFFLALIVRCSLLTTPLAQASLDFILSTKEVFTPLSASSTIKAVSLSVILRPSMNFGVLPFSSISLLIAEPPPWTRTTFILF